MPQSPVNRLFPLAFWTAAFLSAATPLRAKPHATPLVVNTQSLILHDDARDRDIPVKLYYPRVGASPARLPVILFSPEAGSSRDGYSYLGRYWAQHGYLCVFVTHKGSDTSLLKRGKPLASLRAIVQSTQKDANLADRPKDLSFVADSLASLDTRVSDLKGRVDPTRLGVAGHSFGAQAALALAGAAVHFSDGSMGRFQDNRACCFVLLSPPGTSDPGFDEASFKAVPRPVLCVSGSQDHGLDQELPEWRREAFHHMPPHHKFEIVLAGAGHMDLSDRQLDGSRGNSKYHPYVEQATLAFWDAYLKGDQNVQQQLSEGRFPTAKHIKASIQVK